MYIEIIMALGAFFIYRTGCSDVIKNAILDKVGRLKSLNNLVSTTEKNKMRAALISFKLICRAMYIVLIQYMNNSVIRIDNKTYELTYVIKGKMHKMIVIPKRGPTPILLITNDKGEDITNNILPYMGPQYDWHGYKFNPKFFNCNSLTFEMGDGSEITHENDFLPDLSK